MRLRKVVYYDICNMLHITTWNVPSNPDGQLGAKTSLLRQQGSAIDINLFRKQKSRPPELMADANYLGELSPPHSPARMRKSSSVRRDYVRPFIQGPDPTFGRCFIWHNLFETRNLDLSYKGRTHACQEM